MANPFTSKQSGTYLMPGEWDTQQRRIDYERQMAEALGADSEMPKGSMAGNVFVPPSWTQYLAKALNPMFAKQRMNELDQRQQKINDDRMAERGTTLQAFSKALAGTPEGTVPHRYEAGNNPDEQSGIGEAYQPAVAGSRDAAMNVLAQSKDPMIQQLYMAQALKEPDKPVVVGRTLVDPRTGKQVAVDSTWQSEQQAAREEKARQAAEALQARRELAAQQEAMRRDIAAQSSADRRMIAGMVNARQEQKNVPKLPTSALKMQQEELDAIGTSGAINADLGALDKQIEAGKLQLGPVNNLMAKAKNMVGASDESSRNLASFQSTLEKLRNDSLRLNKGVQTEGDAQRAWNELIANINDPKLVRQRLGEIQKINDRAANLRRMNVETIRANFGVEPMDTAQRLNQPAAVGGGGANVDDLLKKYGG